MQGGELPIQHSANCFDLSLKSGLDIRYFTFTIGKWLHCALSCSDYSSAVNWHVSQIQNTKLQHLLYSVDSSNILFVANFQKTTIVQSVKGANANLSLWLNVLPKLIRDGSAVENGMFLYWALNSSETSQLSNMVIIWMIQSNFYSWPSSLITLQSAS